MGKALVYHRFTDILKITNYNEFILSFIVFVIIVFLFQELMTKISRDKATKFASSLLALR